MARTLKRQRVRQLRDAAKHEAHAASLMSTHEDISEELWAKLEETLLGLLDFHMDYDATDLKHFCPRNVRLIVRLDLVRAGASNKVEQLIQRVMDALGMLCLLLEASGGCVEMCTRVLLSHMMVSPWDTEEDEDVIHGVAASIRAHGLHVVFAWQGRKFQSYAAEAIGAFLRTPRLHNERSLGARFVDDCPRLMRVGMQFADCQLTAQDVNSVMKALAIEELTTDSDFKDVPLSGVFTLHSLTFNGVPLREAELDALAVGLASPLTRRVDSLSLESMLVLGSSAKYVPAFQRVLVAALQSKHTDVSACPGLKLSLDRNDLIQPVHVEALQEALTLATRPLSALSVASIPGGDIGTWLRLGQIIFTPSRIQVDGVCELDISHITKEEEAIETLSRSLGTLVSDMIPRVSSALLASEKVYCRVSGDEIDDLSPHEMYEVVSVRASGESFSGWMQIKTPTAVEESSTWVSSSSITYLRIGEEDVVGCRFTSLVARGDWYSGTFVSVLRLLGWVGHGLRHLNLGDRQCVARALPAVMNTCPNLQELDLQYSNLSNNQDLTVWNDMPLHSIKAISLRHCYLTADSVTDLVTRILAAPNTPLRYLDLRSNNGFDANTIDVLLKLIQKNRTLSYVEMPDMCLGSNTPEEVALRKLLETIDQYLVGEYLSPEIKLALLSVSWRRQDLRWDDNIVGNIFAFTGSRQKRVVRWNRREPEA